VGFRDRRPEARNGGELAVRSSVKLLAANDNLKDDLIRYTRQVWQPRLGRDLSREDVREIAENVIGFPTILVEWSRVERLAAWDEAFPDRKQVLQPETPIEHPFAGIARDFDDEEDQVLQQFAKPFAERFLSLADRHAHSP
jgi:hypothetical protein